MKKIMISENQTKAWEAQIGFGPREKDGQWCGKHKPQGSDICPKHGLRWEELHENLQAYAIATIFYCPVLDCDNFDYAVDYSNYGSTVPYKGTSDYLHFHIETRLKILFHKLGQREGDGK